MGRLQQAVAGMALAALAAASIAAAQTGPAIVTGAGETGGPHVRGWMAAGVPTKTSFMAYSVYGGGVRVAAGDVNGDGTPDIVTAPGLGGPSEVKVFDGRTRAQIRSLFPYGAAWGAGLFVAAADVSGDGKADIVLGTADFACCTTFRVFDGESGRQLAGVFPFGQSVTSGARVAAADVSGDGRAEVIVGRGPGDEPRVSLFAAEGGDTPFRPPFRSFLAFDRSVTSGVAVAAADTDGDGRAEIVAGAATGGAPQVNVFDARSDAAVASFFPYAGPVSDLRLAAADFNADGRAEIVTAASVAGGSWLKVFDARGLVLSSFFSAEPDLAPGVSIAAADLTGDGRAEIIAGTGPSSGTQGVSVFDFAGIVVARLAPYDPPFTGGVRVAAGDVVGDREIEIVTAPGAGMTAEVRIFSPTFDPQTGNLVGSFTPFGAAATGGAFVAAGDLDGDRKADIAVGAGEPAEPRVKLFSGAGRELSSFLAYPPAFRGGVRVAVGDVDGDGRGEVVTGSGAGGSGLVHVFRADGTLRSTFAPFDPPAVGGLFVATADLQGDGRAEIVVTAEAADDPAIRVLDATTGASLALVRVPGPVRVAGGDVDADGRDEIVAATGPGVEAVVLVFDELRLLTPFSPYPGFGGRTFVAVPAPLGPALVPSGRRISARAGTTFRATVATFTDSAGRQSAAPFRAAVQWGDGVRSEPRIVAMGAGRFAVIGRKRYAKPGLYRVRVTISEIQGRTVVARAAVRVAKAKRRRR